MKKVYYNWQHVENLAQEILRQMALEAWRPDYVVGLTRGGLVPANLISQYLEVPMETLKVSLRDGDQSESNLWMAEDAFGYNMDRPKNILIVDDINDSGATLQWIRDDWRSSCLPSDQRWDTVWGYNVRVAVLINNQVSEFKHVDYVGLNINKFEEPVWCVYPWEAWWK